MGSNVRTIIIFWGVAILLYITVSRSAGSTSVLNSFTNFVTKGTSILQGR